MAPAQGLRGDDEERVERAAFELYAAGPWGSFEGVSGPFLHTVTCSHSMDVYREMVRVVLAAAGDGFQVFAEMVYDGACSQAEGVCPPDHPCGSCAAADALGKSRWTWGDPRPPKQAQS